MSLGTQKAIGSHNFTGWGAHCDTYPCAYFTAAAAIGMKKEEVDVFVKRLDKVFTKFKRKHTGSKLAVEPPQLEGDSTQSSDEKEGMPLLLFKQLCLSVQHAFYSNVSKLCSDLHSIGIPQKTPVP